MPDRQWLLIEADRVPRTSAIASAVFAHITALALIFLFWRGERVHVVPAEDKISEIISGPIYLESNSLKTNGSQSHSSQARSHQRKRVASLPAPASAGQSGGDQILQQQAKQDTAEIIKDLKFRQIYGFSLRHKYQLPSHAAGELPYISSIEVPPHFEQYVIVEVTIGVDGHVADARIITGIVPPEIQQKLLSAVHEFKYSPATRDGVPIPSQLDVVIHVPS